jgi:hypothetical protein
MPALPSSRRVLATEERPYHGIAHPARRGMSHLQLILWDQYRHSEARRPKKRAGNPSEPRSATISVRTVDEALDGSLQYTASDDIGHPSQVE